MASSFIKLFELYSLPTLVTRHLARVLFNNIKEADVKSVLIDFDQIEMVSRSFLDELLGRMSLLEKEDIHVDLINLNNDITQLKSIIENRKRSRIPDDTEIVFEVIRIE